MVDPDFVQQDFQHRLREIPLRGMGLSVDVYSPDLFELVNKLRERGLQPGYLEVFKATTTALTTVRQAVPDIPLAYHGEGLWITQPDVQESPFFQQDVGEMVTQLNSIQSLWLNHECAMKQMAGYSFGTYVPPLYTRLSAEVVAANIAAVQQEMDRQGRRADGTAPLFLLEMPPLTYFSAGTIPIPHFFRLVTALVPCGLVLDIGHLWTVYRYTGACRRTSLERFVREFLDEFPLERGWPAMSRLVSQRGERGFLNGSTPMPRRFRRSSSPCSNRFWPIRTSSASGRWRLKWTPNRSR